MKKDVWKPGYPKKISNFIVSKTWLCNLVIQARLQGVELTWIGADSLYGEDPGFLRSLDQMHEIFMVDVHKDQLSATDVGFFIPRWMHRQSL